MQGITTEYKTTHFVCLPSLIGLNICLTTKVNIPLEHPVDYLLSHKNLNYQWDTFKYDSFLVIFASCCGILPAVHSLIVMMFSHTFAHVIFLCASSRQVDCDNQQHCAKWGLRQRQIAREDKGKHAFLQCVIHPVSSDLVKKT